VLLRGEDSEGRVAVIERTMPPGATGPPPHTHAFDEAFYVLEGELVFQVGAERTSAHAGEIAFALGGTPHTLTTEAKRPRAS
jgi:quercetin dioxygenase-like cupin family protein